MTTALFAQGSLVSSTLAGTVSDTTGGRIPGATVTIRDTSTHFTREVATDAEGAFRAAELPPGVYEVLVNQPGFSPYRHSGVTLSLGSTVRLGVVVQSGAVSSQLTVSAQPSPIDPARTSLTSSVDTERIEELPVESRNYLHFALLAPGVTISEHHSASPDSGFTFGGLRGRSNNVTIDGLDNNDEFLGASRTELSLETVQEFQVVNTGLSAESGGASGGSINVITRVGTNSLHGDAFIFTENGSLNARNPFESESATPMLHKYRAGVALGGPIVKDRTFYYAAFEQEHNRGLEDPYFGRAVAAAVNRLLGSPRVSDNFFPTSRSETEASAKVNHQVNTRNTLMFRYAYTNNRETGDAFNNLGWYDASARGSSFTQDNAFVGAWTTIFDPESVGDFRFQFADRRAVTRTNDAAGSGYDIAGAIEFGHPWEGNGRRTERHQQATYTYSRAHGHHLLKAGATYNRVGLDAYVPDGFGGLYIYASLADFLAGRLDQFRQAVGNPRTNFAVSNVGAFVQDHWTLIPKLTLDLGVRYDVERIPSVFHQDLNNVSPRVGLAYQPSQTWIVRAGYGIFYDRYVLAALNRTLMVVSPRYNADPHMATPYSQQASVAIEHQIATNLTATASFLTVRGVKLPRTRLFQLEDSASSTYHGASFTLNRRMSDEFEASVSYTLSKTYDDASDWTDQSTERAISLQHQQQRLVCNALWELPIGDEAPPTTLLGKAFQHIELAPIVTLGSGRPVNPLTGIDTYRTGVWPLYANPVGYSRNSLRTAPFYNIDFRVLRFFPLSKTARLDIVGEAFNLLNHPNVSQINPVFGPSFRQPLLAAGGRQIQFSIDFEF
jgi:hypothetical protein